MPADYEQTILDALQEASRNGQTYVTANEVTQVLVKKLGLVDKPESVQKQLRTELHTLVTQVLRKYWPGRTTYSVARALADVGLGTRIELTDQPKTRWTHRTLPIDKDLLIRIYKELIFIQGYLPTDLGLLAIFEEEYPWLLQRK